MRESCGVFGICYPGGDVARLTYFALFALQRRAQKSAGIAILYKGTVINATYRLQWASFLCLMTMDSLFAVIHKSFLPYLPIKLSPLFLYFHPVYTHPAEEVT